MASRRHAAIINRLRRRSMMGGGIIPVGLVVLAFAQIGVHLVFFLHLGSGPDNTNNIMALAYGVLIVFLVIGGSIWIIANLGLNMMEMFAHGAAKLS
jgi:cytochrome o ubiquinol oxidase subunit IV